jgi:hypothetical protein
MSEPWCVQSNSGMAGQALRFLQSRRYVVYAYGSLNPKLATGMRMDIVHEATGTQVTVNIGVLQQGTCVDRWWPPLATCTRLPT